MIDATINMIPDKCSLCGGNDDSGEAYYTPDISRKIDVVMEKFHQGKLLARPIPASEVEVTI